jgi:predicted HD superfamily hydrolase involved in NAD metabolism
MCSIIFNVMICTAEALERLLKRDLGQERLAHSRRVADLAADLCLTYGLEGEKGRLSGLAHDWARDLPAGRVRELALRDGRGESVLEAQYPVLLHGRAAAVGLREKLGIEDPEILEAVACHVTGCPGMGLLAKIVFVADFLEPGRGFLPEEVRKGMLRMDIDEMTLRVLEEIFGYLHGKHRAIAQPALELFEELRGP